MAAPPSANRCGASAMNRNMPQWPQGRAKTIQVIGFPMYLGADRPGMDLGPAAIQTDGLMETFAERVCSVRCASNHLIISVYRVPPRLNRLRISRGRQVQGVGRAGVHSYFKCPTARQMRSSGNTDRNFNLASLINSHR